jgi:hypothetical protein
MGGREGGREGGRGRVGGAKEGCNGMSVERNNYSWVGSRGCHLK